jgi:hypothetical protein
MYTPHNNVVLCKKIVREKQNVIEDGLVYEIDELPIYEVIKIGEKLNHFTMLKPGDKIISNSIPTRLDDELYLIREEYIAGKIVES